MCRWPAVEVASDGPAGVVDGPLVKAPEQGQVADTSLVHPPAPTDPDRHAVALSDFYSGLVTGERSELSHRVQPPPNEVTRAAATPGPDPNHPHGAAAPPARRDPFPPPSKTATGAPTQQPETLTAEPQQAVAPFQAGPVRAVRSGGALRPPGSVRAGHPPGRSPPPPRGTQPDKRGSRAKKDHPELCC